MTLSRECFGPDVGSSLTTPEWARLVEGVRFIEKALAHPMDKNAMAAELASTRAIFSKSLVAARDLPAGIELSVEDITAKKPGTGLPASRLGEFVNRRLRGPVSANHRFSEEDFE